MDYSAIRIHVEKRKIVDTLNGANGKDGVRRSVVTAKELNIKRDLSYNMENTAETPAADTKEGKENVNRRHAEYVNMAKIVMTTSRSVGLITQNVPRGLYAYGMVTYSIIMMADVVLRQKIGQTVNLVVLTPNAQALSVITENVERRSIAKRRLEIIVNVRLKMNRIVVTMLEHKSERL